MTLQRRLVEFKCEERLNKSFIDVCGLFMKTKRKGNGYGISIQRLGDRLAETSIPVEIYVAVQVYWQQFEALFK